MSSTQTLHVAFPFPSVQATHKEQVMTMISVLVMVRLEWKNPSPLHVKLIPIISPHAVSYLPPLPISTMKILPIFQVITDTSCKNLFSASLPLYAFLILVLV